MADASLIRPDPRLRVEDPVARYLLMAMRAEMAAQTNAIANSITAARTVQPQIIVLPPETIEKP
jgi:hypothetical protein